MSQQAKYSKNIILVVLFNVRDTSCESRTYNVGDFHQAGDIVSFGFG